MLKSSNVYLLIICFIATCVIILSSYFGIRKLKVENYEEDDEEESDNEDNIWQKLDVDLKSVSTSGDLVCGTTNEDAIKCSKRNSSKWETIPGSLSQLSLSGNKICGVNRYNDIYCADNALHPEWQHIPGKLTQVDISGNQVCGVGLNQDIWCSDYKKANWRRLPGWLKQLSVSGRTLCGVNGNNDLYCTNSTYEPNWKHIDRDVSFIDVSGNKMCGLGTKGDIKCADYADKNWQRKPGEAKWLSFDDETSYVVGKDGKGYYNGNILKMKYVEPPENYVEKNEESVPNRVLFTDESVNEINRFEDKVCRPAVAVLDKDAYKYATINKYLLVNEPREDNTCYIKDLSAITSGDCDANNRDLFDKRVIKNIYKSTVRDPYVSETVPMEVCTLSFKKKIDPKNMNNYLSKLDSLAPNVRVVGEKLQELQNNSELLDDLATFEVGNLNTAKSRLADTRENLARTNRALEEARNSVANVDNQINDVRRKIEDTKNTLRFGWV